MAAAELFDGKLALITNEPYLTPAETVARYKGLADIEQGFRVLKSDIEIALVLYRIMSMRLKAKGHTAITQTARDLLRRIQKHTTHIGQRRFTGTSRTTAEQLELFDTLDLKNQNNDLGCGKNSLPHSTSSIA